MQNLPQEKLGHGWTWLNDVTVDDWSRFHRLQKTEDQVHSEFRALASGSVADHRLNLNDKPIDTMMKLKDEVDDTVDEFEGALDKASKMGVKRLRGTITDSMRGAYEQAKVALGIETPVTTPTDLAGSASSILAAATASAASAYGGLSDTVAAAIPEINLSSASSALHDATRAASRALGATPTPESFDEHASSAYARASQAVVGEPSASGISASASSAASVASASAASAYNAISDTIASAVPDSGDLSSSLHEATRAAMRAVGATPSPEGVAEHAQSAYDRASSAVVGTPAASGVSASASSVISVASASASSLANAAGASGSSYANVASKSASSLASAASASAVSAADYLGDTAASAYSVVSSSIPDLDNLSSSLHDATRAAARAVGATPSPEGAAEHAQSAYARASSALAGSPAASGVSASASSAASVASASASSVVSVASSAATSLASSVSSAVHDATRVAQRAVGGEPSPENVREHYSSATRAVSRKLAPSPAGVAEEARAKVDEAIRQAKDAAERVAQRLEL